MHAANTFADMRFAGFDVWNIGVLYILDGEAVIYFQHAITYFHWQPSAGPLTGRENAAGITQSYAYAYVL
jgi:hypothetical protein